MDEPVVFKRISDWLYQDGHRFFVHIPSTYRSDEVYGEIVSRFQTHQITIGGYRPDILGFTPANRVFAVEVKGNSNLRKGLGQAASYQRGVNHAYLAADANSLSRVRDVILSKGIGIYSVSEATVSPVHPNAVDLRDQLHNTRQQLEGLLMNPERGSQRLPNYADPLNNLMPLLAVEEHNCSSKAEISDLCEDIQYPYQRASNRMVDLAQSLGMLTVNDTKLQITEQGRLGRSVLRGCDIDSVHDLMELKYGPRLQEKQSDLAVFLRNRFAAIPEYRTVFELLIRHDERRISIQELCKLLIENYPSTFLNLVYTKQSDHRDAPQLIETGNGEMIHEDPEYLASIIHSQFISNTVSQFRSMGILTKYTSPIEPKSALRPEQDYWYPGSFSLR
jgi:hypothetical protein